MRLAEAALRPERKVKPPPTVYITGDGRHRCCGAFCGALLEGRRKKCERCKARELQAAIAAGEELGMGRGRGRRRAA